MVQLVCFTQTLIDYVQLQGGSGNSPSLEDHIALLSCFVPLANFFRYELFEKSHEPSRAELFGPKLEPKPSRA